MATSKVWKWGYITPEGKFAIPPSFDGASSFYEGLAAVKIDWARGYIDRNGVFVIKPIFEAASDFMDGFAEVKLDGQAGYIDKKGDFRSDVDQTRFSGNKIESGYNPVFEDHDGMIRFIENQKYGYKDEEGNIIIAPQFFDAADFSEGLACIKRGKTSSWGFINKAGKMVIPASFKQAKSFHEGLAAVLTAVDEK